MRNKRKFYVFTSLLVLMLSYIGWIFYMSEPTYINNNYKKIEKYDYVTIPSYRSNDGNINVEAGIVLQTDSSSAMVKVDSWSELKEVNIKEHNYRIVGKGTFYHKVNNYVGTNIMFITQIIISILSALLLFSLVSMLLDFLN